MEEVGCMSEKRAFTKLKNALVVNRIERRLERVENLVNNGWPDANGCFHGVEFWIEVKEPKEPKMLNTRLFGSNHKLSQEQMNWIKRQINTGGLAYVYIDTGEWRLLIGGSMADYINDMTLTELKSVSLWSTKVPIKCNDHWEGIVDVILNRKV
jgi:hypothetical protein